jgi:hypothetical protein
MVAEGPIDDPGSRPFTRSGRDRREAEMSTNQQAKQEMRVRTGVKAGGAYLNHSESALKVRTGVKAGGLAINHSEPVLAVRSV